MNFQCYADTQLYLAITPTSNWIDIASRLQMCLSDIRSWMRSNYLKINQEKTELIVFQNTKIITSKNSTSILTATKLASHQL